MSPMTESAILAATDQVINEYEEEKEREPFGKEYEIINGKLEPKEMGSSRHSGVGSRLLARMLIHAETNMLGGVYGPDASFQIGKNERLPDVSFLSAARIPDEGETDEKWHVAPDLAVEIVSPNDPWEKVESKILDYFAAGVRQVWLISLEHIRVYIYDSPKLIRILTEEEELTSEELLPGFRCRISELFQQPARSRS